jgi:hypothetical protein
LKESPETAAKLRASRTDLATGLTASMLECLADKMKNKQAEQFVVTIYFTCF